MNIDRAIFPSLVYLFLAVGSWTAQAQFFAELSYKLWTGDCPPLIKNVRETNNSTLEADTCWSCTHKSGTLSRINLLSEESNETAEATYLAGLAEIRDQQLACTEKQISRLMMSPGDLTAFVRDYQAKVTLLGIEKRRMKELKTTPMNPASLRAYENSRMRALALIESLPFADIAPFRKVITYVISQYETYAPDRLDGWLEKQTADLIKKATKASFDLIKENRTNLRTGIQTGGASLDTNTRESLAQDTDLVETFRNENSEIQNLLKPLACRVDAKYGSGAQYRDRTLIGLSIVGPGAALGLAKIGVAGLASSLTGAVAAGSISIRTAGILRVLAAAGGTAASLSQAQSACFGQEVSLSGKTTKNRRASSCEESVLASQSAENCLLVSVLNTLGIYATTKVAKEALGQITSGRIEAVKAITPQKVASEEQLRQLLREASLEKNLEAIRAQHSALSPLREEWKAASTRYHSTERKLKTLIQANEPKDAKEIAELTAQVETLKSDFWKIDSQLKTLEEPLRKKWEELMAACPSGRCVTPETRTALIRTGSIDLSPNPQIPFRTQAIVDSLEAGQEMDSMFVITHQVFDFTTDATLKMLKTDPRFKKVPRVILGGDDFKVNSRDLYEQATVVKFSSRGELPDGLVLNSKEFHFAGGYCQWCLRRTISQITDSLASGRQGNFVFHSHQMYWDKQRSLGQVLDEGVKASASPREATNFILRTIEDMTGLRNSKLISDPTSAERVIEAITPNYHTIRIRIEP